MQSISGKILLAEGGYHRFEGDILIPNWHSSSVWCVNNRYGILALVAQNGDKSDLSLPVANCSAGLGCVVSLGGI